MTRRDWRELWHCAQDGEQLSGPERERLSEALRDVLHRQAAESWEEAAGQLRRAPLPERPQALSPALPGPSPSPLAHAAVQDIQLQRALSRPAPRLRSLAAEVAGDVALSRQLSADVRPPRPLAADLAAQIAQEALVPERAALGAGPLPALLRQWPRPELPRSLAADLSARVAAEAPGSRAFSGSGHAPPSEELPATLPPLGRTRLNPPGGPSGLGGLGVVLAFGGLTVLRGSPAAQQTLGTLIPVSLPIWQVLGVGLLALLSWLIVARPTPAVRRLGALAFAMTGVLTLPALWDALQHTPLQAHLAVLSPVHPAPHLLLERWLGAGLLLAVTALLLRGGWGARLARRQRRAPIQTLAAGTLAGLALGGLALMLLSFGWAAASTALGVLGALAAAIGLSVSLHAAGRSVARRLHLAWPEVSGPLAGLLAFSASLSVPALAAGLALIGSAWGLGTLLLGREAAQL